MRKLGRTVGCALLAVSMMFGSSVGTFAAEEKANRGLATKETSKMRMPAISAGCGILIDAKTGKILYSKNIDKKSYPASITKILTTLVAIDHNKYLNETVHFTDNAINSIEPGSTAIGIEPGENIPLEDVLYAIMLESANEACNGVAEHTARSLKKFANLMNQKAQELGCSNSHFVTTNGLHNKEHYVTARDMATITKAALNNPTFRKISCSSNHYMAGTNKEKKGREMWNHHKMVKRTAYLYRGIEGGKTGYTTVAGGTLVTFCKRNNTELISVVLRGSTMENYKDTTTLMNYGFNNYKSVTPFKGLNRTLKVVTPVTKTANELVPYVMPLGDVSDISVLLTKNQKEKDLKVYTEKDKVYAKYGAEELGAVSLYESK